MQQLNKGLVDTFRGLYGLTDWRVAVRVSRSHRSNNCGTTVIRTPYREASITLYPVAIRETQKRFPFETAESVLHHEFAHIALEALAPGLAMTVEQEEMAVEYLSAMVMRLVPIYGVDECITG